MGFIDNYEIIVSPVYTGKIYTIGFTSSSSEIGMIEDIIVESILYERIIFIIIQKSEPVIPELLRTENKDTFISFLIILDNPEC